MPARSALMSGNAVILRGGIGGDATATARSTPRWSPGWPRPACPPTRSSSCRVTDRAAVGAMLRAAGLIDIIVPRGGKSLVARVQDEARVPVLAHLDGINHIYIDAAADPAMARGARGQRQDAPHRRLRRDRDAADRPRLRRPAPILAALVDAGCEVRGDAAIAGARPARRARRRPRIGTPNISTRSCSVALVDGVDGRDRAYRRARIAPHRRDRHRGCRHRRALPGRGRSARS